MHILYYRDLDTSRVTQLVEKVVRSLQREDFYSAGVKKLVGTPYYRAKLDDAHRLLFKIITYQGQKYALLLEVILHHAYEKSRFLRGAPVKENAIESEDTPLETLPYINPQNAYFHVLDKILSLDDLQETIFNLSPPLILIGSAGSGKTVLLLEKMKTYPGDVLYVTGSPYLVQNARDLYYANHYSNDEQTVDFLSYRELLETLQVPDGKEMDFTTFAPWAKRITQDKYDPQTLYEEFKGVLTGNQPDTPYLTKAEYLALGIKQSIYNPEERADVYALFEKYRALLQETSFYDTNLVSYHYLARAEPRYAFLVVDEVQDFTLIQLTLLFKMLRTPTQFMLCGDANQIVHPNFFSWAKIKSLFYAQPQETSGTLLRVLHKNYRNAHAVTALANQVLKVKQARFGSIDKESHYLVESQSPLPGEVYCLHHTEKLCQDINSKTNQSTHFAILVLHEDQKAEASRLFQTPLIFSIYEAKGLEYEQVLLYNFISTQAKKFQAIAQGVNPAALQGEFVYGRAKDKADRSLEMYKFYINAFFVAITRAIKSVYILETVTEHPFLTLLDLKPTESLVALETQTSSREEWQKEMQRLELQGKQAQAEAIRATHLETTPVPWDVITSSALTTLREKALQPVKDKAARLRLFEYALVYQDAGLLTALANVGFTPALHPEKGWDLLERQYFVGYTTTSPQAVLQQVTRYGVDFRSPFNQTPLMMASHFGHHVLIKQLLEKGATPYLIDNNGRNACQLALQRAFINKKFAQRSLVPCWDALPAGALHLQAEGKLLKIDEQQMVFFLIQGMMAMRAQQKAHSPFDSWLFTVEDFLKALQPFPDTLVPQKRKRRAYLSSLLAKNEVHRQDRYNRQLFLRIQHGHYTFSRTLQIKVNEAWVNLTALLGIDTLIDGYFERINRATESLKKWRETYKKSPA